MPDFGARSLKILGTVHPVLRRVCYDAIKVYDYSVIDGHRSTERQRDLFAQGATKIDGITNKSAHNHIPSLAVDLLPYPYVLHGVDIWADEFRFHILAGVMMACAHSQGVQLRWGGDWDRDGSRKDQTFHDLPHFELYPLSQYT